MSKNQSGVAFIIRKSTRCEVWPYSGPSCDRAGIVAGKIYESEELAQTDARKLAKVNGVGWHVVPVVLTEQAIEEKPELIWGAANEPG